MLSSKLVQKDFLIKKVKNTVLWMYVIYMSSTLQKGKELQKTNQTQFRIEKIIKRKGDKLYVKQKGYDNSFNSQIDKKDT